MYPKRLFAATGGSVVVNDAHHERALGPGWLDNEVPPSDPATDPAEDTGDATGAGAGDATDTGAGDATDPGSAKRKKR